MADRTFTLIGDFTDHITPALNKINTSLDSVKKSIASVSAATAPLKQDFAQLTTLSKDFNLSLQGQTGGIKSNASALREYRLEMAKLNRVHRRLKFPNTSGSGGYRGGGNNGGFGGGGGGGIARDSSFVFSQVLGNQVAGLMTNAIAQGFQIGVALMVKPFEYLQSALKERIADEQSDIKAAGGYFSIAQRQTNDKKFINSFAEAMEFTQQNNKLMAQIAGALPGNTQQYIEVSKRLSDSIARTVLSDPKKAIEYANKLRTDPERIGGAVAKITGSGPEAIRQTISELQGVITKKTVLAGLGGGAQGGVAGAYGLPGLSERLITQEKVSMGQFQRYAAIFRDPMISDALSRYIPKINATQAASIDRVKVLEKMFDDILPPEVIRAFMRSTGGIIEALNTAILGPETGLFGLGRKMKNMGKKMDDYGRVIEGEIDLSVFDLLRDIFANITLSLQPLVDILPLVFDPLKAIGGTLVDMRHVSGQFLFAFESYKEGITRFANSITSEADRLKFSEGGMVAARASFAAINNFFRGAGVYGKGAGAMAQFQENAKKIMSLNLDPAAMLKEFADTFMNSQVSHDLGKSVGLVIRTVLQQVSNLLDQITGVAKTSKLVQGFKEGVGNEGKAAIINIIKRVFEGIASVILEVIKTFPLETAFIGLFALLAPALTAAFSNALGVRLERIIDRGLPSSLGGTGGGGGRGGRTPGPIGSFFGPTASVRKWRRPYAQGAQILAAHGKGAALGLMGAASQRYRGILRQRTLLGGAARSGARMARLIPGGALVAGALNMGFALATGENFGKAAANTLGVVLGGAVGSIFGPVGTIVGSMAGGMIADAGAGFITNMLSPTRQAAEAAKIQLTAAQAQLEAATKRASGAGAGDIGPSAAMMADPLKYLNVLKLYNLDRDPAFKQHLLAVTALSENIKLEETARTNLNKLIADYASRGYRPEQIASLTEYRAVQTEYNRIRSIVANQGANVDRLFNNLPKATTNAITKTFQTMSTKEIEYAIANRISLSANPVLTLIPPNKGGLSPLFDLTSPKKGGLPPINLGTGTGLTLPSGNVETRFSGSLGDAISKEMKMKPPGSDLVIANSSETVIPAAGGNGMGSFLSLLRSGFNSAVVALKQLNDTLNRNQQKNDSNFKLLGEKFTSPSMPGGLGGAKAGGVDAFTPLAQSYGLTMVSGYRPGDPGWHGANRARDFSNGSGPTSQMLQFAYYLASNYGSNLKELIYTPLGFSIKNGRKVAPYAQSGHFNHVHVAYAYGPNSPAFFSRQRDAIAWEKAMMPGGAKVASVTTNSREGFGATIQPTINIYQQPGQDPEELARIVIARFDMAVQTVLNHM